VNGTHCRGIFICSVVFRARAECCGSRYEETENLVNSDGGIVSLSEGGCRSPQPSVTNYTSYTPRGTRI
jgi:hypothetical protein